MAFELHKSRTKKLDTCSIWSVPVFDGDNIVVSCEGDGKLYATKLTLGLEVTTSPREIASSKDVLSKEPISDHKHIYQNGHHFIVFSTRGDGSGGELTLIKLDKALSRMTKVTVVSNDPPTNDLFMVGDGEFIYIGKFDPQGGGHTIYTFDEDLRQVGETVNIGGFNREFGDLGHSNGASAIFDNDKFS